MNEVTRIHIAKVSYDIEIAAKKQLEKYSKSLETYAQDSEVLTDIEIRMTEILAERGVPAGGVISSDDVKALREQLGEPYEFADESGDIAVGSSADGPTRSKLYRRTDDAVLGGVLSGIGAYFDVSPVWVRLIFVVLCFVSFGFALFVYLLLWVIVPPARSATEKLQLAGRPVTVGSIRELSTEEEAHKPNRVAPVLQRILTLSFGIGFLLAAIGVLIVTCVGFATVFTRGHIGDLSQVLFGFTFVADWASWLSFWLLVTGGLLLSTLCGLVAYAFLTRSFSKRLLVSIVITIVLGVAILGTIVGVNLSQYWRHADQLRSLVTTRKVVLPTEFATIHSVVIENSSSTSQIEPTVTPGQLHYIVASGTPHYELTALPTVNVSVKVEAGVAHLSLSLPAEYQGFYTAQPTLVVYGPALTDMTTGDTVTDVQYIGNTQSAFTVHSRTASSIVVNGSYTSLTAEGASGSIDVAAATVESLTVQSGAELTVRAGTVRALTVVQPDVCPAGSQDQPSAQLDVVGVTSGVMTYNGAQRSAQSYKNNCAAVTIGDQSE